MAPGAAAPSALDLARLRPRSVLPASRAALFRHIARMSELGGEQEFLVVPAGGGETTRHFAELTGASGAGVDPDARMVETASERARDAGLAARVHFDQAELTDLPYKDDIFDLSIAEIGIPASADAEAAVRELVRVTKPMGMVFLVQPVWMQSLDERRRELLVRRLGIRPYLLQKWKQMLRDAGVVELQAEDLSEAASSRTGSVSIRGLTDYFAYRSRFRLLWAAWKRWGWRGITAALDREHEIRRLTSRERLLGLGLIRGTKWPDQHNPT